MSINILRLTSLMLFGVISFLGCKDDFPKALDSSSSYTVLESIKLINAGENGNVVLEGNIDENTKTVNFPRIDTLTNFSNLKFEAKVSDGAKLDKETYSIQFQEGQSSNHLILKVVNNLRSREYIVRLRLLIPLFGADFEKGEVCDYSTNPVGNPAYPSFTGLATRGTGFDGEHVLIIDRGSQGPHLLKVSDLKNNEINRIPLNTTGIIGGTFPYNMGAQVNGHTYVASLSTSGTNPLKIYHWASPGDVPEVIADLQTSLIFGAGARNGDNFSITLDEQGNGYIFFISGGLEILRLKVNNYNQISSPTGFPASTSYGQWSSYLQVGNSESFLLTSNIKPISVVSESGTASYTMKTSSVPVQGTDARIIEFNKERYLMLVTVARTGAEVASLLVYDITRGKDLIEALTLFEDNPQSAVFEYNLSSTTNIAPAAQTGYKIIKDADGNDEKLVLYAAHTDAGFALIEFPVKKFEDDE